MTAALLLAHDGLAAEDGAATEARPPVPPPAPLSMPAQRLDRAPAAAFDRPGLATRLARVVTFGGALALTVAGARQMWLVLATDSPSALQNALLGLFVIAFGWIALSATSAIAGLVAGLRRPPAGRGAASPAGRTALVMPLYGEDAAASFGSLAAIATGLRRLGMAGGVEIFVLSDTRDADGWVRESTALAALRAEIGGALPVWYRRRRANLARKAGNVQDFVERWGDRYDFMLVLDADSVMAPETVAEMIWRMAGAPRLGLLQTAPRLTGGDTPFARLQQFAGSVYGPIVARGVAAWSGEDGNYWGHNALIRVSAFAAAAGLPVLAGRRPLGGHILSHDFVEAALLRRAGWSVRMDTDLGGSWETPPPSVLAAARRDRRWAQGNLQHLGVIGAAGLRWPSRAHFAIGVMSYLMSPIWMAMLAVGLALTAQALYFRPEYFTESFQLFPDWPRFDAVRMGWLFAASMALLLAPKVLGLIAAMLSAETRRDHGGAARLLAGWLWEVLVSSLLAPMAMVLQARHVAQVMLGHDSGWEPQERAGRALPWSVALRAHGLGAALGALTAVGVWVAQPDLLLWLAPVLAGLVLAPWLSRVTGHGGAGPARRLGLLDTPEDRTVPPAFVAARLATDRIRAAMAQGVADLARDSRLAAAHLAALGPDEASRAEEPALAFDAAAARAKLAVSQPLRNRLAALTPSERIALCADPALVRLLAD